MSVREAILFALALIVQGGCESAPESPQDCNHILRRIDPEEKVFGTTVREFVKGIERERVGQVRWIGGVDRVISVNSPNGISGSRISVDIIEDRVFWAEPADGDGPICRHEVVFSGKMFVESNDRGFCDSFNLEFRASRDSTEFRSRIGHTMKFPLTCGSLNANFMYPEELDTEVIGLFGHFSASGTSTISLAGLWSFENAINKHVIATIEVQS